ncbi:hypothetical protein IEO21_05362 [Rhodonia placenta]|uniref:Uncharacterized protein n=1 Tax=Rhodonia placenta TaxID=104341 RepID=A0A8H7P2C7_9APHY|nr:hypothetical protein IEO21_05362 [Postia placenta]
MSETPASLDVVLGGATVLRLDSLDGDKPNLRVEISLETTGGASRDAFMSKFQDWFEGKSGGASGQGNATGIFTPVYRGMLEETAPSGTQHGSAEVAIKCARGVEAVDKLCYEAGLYQNELAPLQGTVAPRYHGFFVSKVDDVEFGCLLLEWCAGGADWPLDRKTMRTAQLHDGDGGISSAQSGGRSR